MGFRKANLIGFDASLANPPENPDEKHISTGNDGNEKEKNKYIEVYNPKDKDHYEFWSTGELIAMAQDIENSLKNQHLMDMELRFYATDKGRSYGGNVVETTPNNTLFPTYQERYEQ
jgi:hypothetical protein